MADAASSCSGSDSDITVPMDERLELMLVTLINEHATALFVRSRMCDEDLTGRVVTNIIFNVSVNGEHISLHDRMVDLSHGITRIAFALLSQIAGREILDQDNDNDSIRFVKRFGVHVRPVVASSDSRTFEASIFV